jgi:hypothetical protein
VANEMIMLDDRRESGSAEIEGEHDKDEFPF